MNNTLLEQIDALVASKTFSLDALDSIKKIKDDFQKTLGSLEYAEAKLADANKTIASMTSELARERANVSALEANIKVNETLVAEGQKAIWEKKIAEGVASAYMHSMEIVFKPSATRETIQRNVAKPVPGSGGNGGYLVNGQESEVVTKEEL
jgi:hypothetical protein